MQEKIAAEGHLQRADGLEVHIVDDQCIVYDTVADRIHYLNPTAALVLEFCDGSRSPAEIAALMQEAYQLTADPVSEVDSCLSSLRKLEIVR